MVKSGIYKIINLVTNKVYVGSAVKLISRKNQHFNLLKRNIHYNKKLQNSFNKYGENNFIFEIIERIEDVNKLIEREQYWIDEFNCVKNGYNISPKAGSQIGYRHTEETRKKLRGKKCSERAKQIYRDLYTGRKLSEEVKNNVKKSTLEYWDTHRNKVVQLDTSGNFIRLWNGIREIFEKLNIYNIESVCNGGRKKSKGFIWLYESDYNSMSKEQIIDICKERSINKSEEIPVFCICLENGCLEYYKNSYDAAKCLNTYQSLINRNARAKSIFRNRVWCFNRDEDKIGQLYDEIENFNNEKIIIAKNIENNTFYRFCSIKQASLQCNISIPYLNKCVRYNKESFGFKWGKMKDFKLLFN